MKCNSRKLFLVVFLSSLFCFSLIAEEESSVNWFTKEMQGLSAQWGLSFPSRRDLRNPAPAEDLILAVDFGELRLDSGIKYQSSQLDLTNHIFYMPTFFNKFQTGVGFTWHYYRYFQEFTENDLIFSTRFRWIKGPVFTFENAYGILFKYTSIDAIKDLKPVIFSYSYNFELLCDWKLFRRSDLWCALNLQDYFDYPQAISPFYKVGLNYAANENLILGIDYTLKFVDMFFSAVYLNESVLRFTVKVAL